MIIWRQLRGLGQELGEKRKGGGRLQVLHLFVRTLAVWPGFPRDCVDSMGLTLRRAPRAISSKGDLAIVGVDGIPCRGGSTGAVAPVDGVGVEGVNRVWPRRCRGCVSIIFTERDLLWVTNSSIWEGKRGRYLRAGWAEASDLRIAFLCQDGLRGGEEGSEGDEEGHDADAEKDYGGAIALPQEMGDAHG